MSKFVVRCSVAAAVVWSCATIQNVYAAELATLAEVQWGDFLPTEGTSTPGTDMATATDTDGEGFNGTANANAAYGSVGVSASGTVVNGAHFTNVASGVAAFSDGMTISGGTPGEAGEVEFTFDITGSSTISGSGTVVAQLWVLQGPLEFEDLVLVSATVEIDQGGFSFTTDPFPFNYDEEFDLTVALSVTSLIAGLPGSVNGTADGSYANTVTLTDINIVDPPSGPTSLSSESGTQYPFSSGGEFANGTAPEPSTAILVAFSLLALATRLGRTRTRRR